MVAIQNMVKADWEYRPCPICGENSSNKLEIQANNPAESMNFREIREFFIGIRSEQIFFSYYRCNDCDLLYCPYYFSKDQLDSLYADMPDNLLGGEKSTAAKTQSGYFDWFDKFVTSIDKFLELGPDIGLVTSAVISRYNPAKTLLVEPNLAMHEQLRQISEIDSDFEIYRDLGEVHTSEIDLTVGIHVFDHLIDPMDQLIKINTQTTSGGFIGIVVHNESSILRKLLGVKWPPFCLQHPQLFNKHSLEFLLKKSGFTKISSARSINHFSINHIGTLAINVIGLPKFLGKFLPSFEVPISLGNQISIYQKMSSE